MANPHDAMHGSSQEEEEFDDLFDTPRIRHVFVAGWPVDIDLPAQNQGGRGGRGGQ